MPKVKPIGQAAKKKGQRARRDDVIRSNLRKYLTLNRLEIYDLAAFTDFEKTTAYVRWGDPGGFSVDELTDIAEKFHTTVTALLQEG